MINKLANLDILGPFPKLYIRSKSKFKTLMGGILTVIYFCITLGFCIYFTYANLARINYTVVYNEEYFEYPSLNFSVYPIAFLLMTGDGMPITPNYIYYTARYYTIKGVNLSFIDVPMRPCSYEDFSDVPIPDELEVAVPFSWCMDKNHTNDKIMYGRRGQPQGQGYYMFFVNYCDPSLNSNCESKGKIDEFIGSPIQLIAFADFIIDNKNISNPGSKIFRSLTTPVSKQLYNKYYFKFREVVYNTDYGNIFPDVKTERYVTMEDFYYFNFGQDEDVYYTGNFGNTLIGMGDKRPTYYRKYERLQTLLANIGGVVKSLLLMAHLFQHFFIRKLYFEYLLNYLNSLEYSRDDQGTNFQKTKYRLRNIDWLNGSQINNYDRRYSYNFVDHEISSVSRITNLKYDKILFIILGLIHQKKKKR
jgi:hypothetical protein